MYCSFFDYLTLFGTPTLRGPSLLFTMPDLIDLQCEHYHNPIGITTASPRLSWRFDGSEKDWKQTAYTITFHRRTVESYRFESSQSILVEWPSTPLISREQITVEVQVEGPDGQTTTPTSLVVEAGLLERSDWKAEMVGGEQQPIGQPKRPFRVRKSFNCPSSFQRARLYVTSYGVHESYINGQRVGDELLAPGWSDYRYHLRYYVHDIGSLLKAGQSNDIGAWLGEGWYCGRLGFRDGVRNVYGQGMGLLAQLEIDGEIIARTDQDWQWSYGNLLASELMDGEVLDSNINDDWRSREGWLSVTVGAFPSAKLLTAESPPVREVERLMAKERIATPSGKIILDFGQNFAGYVQILSEPSVRQGEMMLRYAEVLEHGELGTRPLRAAKATDRIILGGTVKGYKAKFTNHGFRYLEVTGWPDVTVDDFVGIAISTNMTRTGHFECSHEKLNRLHENVIWSTISNTISLPTDCPQRDERLGWTGDIAVFAPTLSFLFEGSGFLREWLRDLYEDQKALGGIVPVIVPTLPLEALLQFNQGIWGDSSITIPWDLYQFFGDEQILRDQFASMRLWLDKGVKRDPDTRLWSTDAPQLGDWLDPSAPPHLPGRGKTDAIMASDAYLVYSTRLLGRICRILGESSLAQKYESNAKDLLTEFHASYVTARSRIMSDSQTALALLLHFDLLDPTKPDQKAIFAARLEHHVIRDFWQVSTGFAGTPIILHTLAANDMLHHAYRMLLARDCPSWLSPVLLGATTIWERWDSMLADGSINPGNMTSFNHYALGAVAHFLHSVVGGLSPASPGWQLILIKPRPGGNLNWANTSFQSPYGLVECRWKIVNDQLEVEVSVPPNATARVELPDGTIVELGSGRRQYSVPHIADERFPPKFVQPEFSRPVDKDWVR